jgi:hypothetical protein
MFTLKFSQSEMELLQQMFSTDIPISLKHAALAAAVSDKVLNAKIDAPIVPVATAPVSSVLGDVPAPTLIPDGT